ncbi:MAG: formate acetyltransferase [Bacteroidales bacterium]|nr:formate acetyltransferase [Bacteroidales bacterium]
MNKSLTQEKQATNRIIALKEAILNAEYSICTERATIWTDYFKKTANRKKAADIQMAEALARVLKEMTITIYPQELIVGNFSSKRVGGSIYPELHGFAVLLDLFKFSSRKVNPLKISSKERMKLLKTMPYWSMRFLAMKAFTGIGDKIKFLISQLKSTEYVINETGGIAHFAPDYEGLVNKGIKGIIEEAQSFQEKAKKGSDQWNFYEGVIIINKAMIDYALRYADEAINLANQEKNSTRKEELMNIAEVCKNVPLNPAKNLQEALQSIFFVQVAINLESLDNGISPGRIDYYLFKFYEKGLASGELNRQQAKELLSAFSIKFAELIPILSEQITEYHSGLMSGQVVCVGGKDADGKDSTNELSYILLEIMEELGLRQPNFHARIHQNSPPEYLNKIFSVLANGYGSPALYNDEIIPEALEMNGYSAKDVGNYTPVGCVEPTVPGKSFASTDAALFNVISVLEKTIYSKTHFESFDSLLKAFEKQMQVQIKKFISDMHAIEKANHLYHPTPLSSSFIEGCISSGICSTGGGAIYNLSGVQCVGAVDAGDSLYAIKKAVFDEKKISFKELISEMKSNFKNEQIRKQLLKIPKFGNDHQEVDEMIMYVAGSFSTIINEYTNYRGGKYVTGLYSMTTHAYFGKITGALPSGRKKGVSFSSGIAPTNGADKSGPTAMFNSLNRIDYTKFANGVNLNVKFNKQTLAGDIGKTALKSLVTTFFKRKGMQVQINVLDPGILKKAQKDPDLYPNILVRVSGYSAFFNDLTLEAQNEIITRSSLS